MWRGNARCSVARKIRLHTNKIAMACIDRWWPGSALHCRLRTAANRLPMPMPRRYPSIHHFTQRRRRKRTGPVVHDGFFFFSIFARCVTTTAEFFPFATNEIIILAILPTYVRPQAASIITYVMVHRDPFFDLIYNLLERRKLKPPFWISSRVENTRRWLAMIDDLRRS